MRVSPVGFYLGADSPSSAQRKNGRMKFSKILIVLLILFSPCLYYNSSGVFSLGDQLYHDPSDVVSLGYKVGQVMEISYSMLLVDISKVVG
jgi:hypothetical protein